MEFTTGEELESKEVDEKKVLTGEELSKQLDRLIQDKANNQRIRDWAEVCETDCLYSVKVTGIKSRLFNCVVASSSFSQANLDEQQTVSNQFVRALMTSVCQSAIICKCA